MSPFSPEEADRIEQDWLVDAPPSPREYLPGPSPSLTTPSVVVKLGVSSCSFDLVVALAAKGFVIVSGPSGTGKSRGGLQLASAMAPLERNKRPSSLYALVPVGADWTDGRYLLGFKNPFGKPRASAGTATNETYEITDTLRLLLAASHSDRQTYPHFLLLDEMNLSHVERYFSAFLSLLEANRSMNGEDKLPLLPAATVRLIADVLADENAASVEAQAAAELAAVGRGLAFPDNFFIIGTVNVDETTYMFSPKVLDRAHVLEMGSVAPSDYINGEGSPLKKIKAHVALNILRRAIDARRNANTSDDAPHQVFIERLVTIGNTETDAQKVFDTVVALLDGAYILLNPIGFGFGYRAVNEVFDYLLTWFDAEHIVQSETAVAGSMGGLFDGWETALDKAFLQKILPKIHGNRRQLGESLLALRAFLEGKDSSSAQGGAKYQIGDSPMVVITSDKVLTLDNDDPMKASRDKLTRMNRRLVAVGYATFVE